MKSLFLIILSLLAIKNADEKAFAAALDYRYQPKSKADPFLPMSFEQPLLNGVEPSKLQRFEVKEYHLVGTLVSSEISALLLIPDRSEGLIARVGERMGKRGGRVISISRERLVVREAKVDVILELRDPDAGLENKIEAQKIPTNVPGISAPLDSLNTARDGGMVGGVIK